MTGTFDALAKLPFVQNKWISTDVWFKLAEQRLNICSEINESYFRRILFEKDSEVSPTPPPAAPVQQRRRINSAISTTNVPKAAVPDTTLPIAALPKS